MLSKSDALSKVAVCVGTPDRSTLALASNGDLIMIATGNIAHAAKTAAINLETGKITCKTAESAQAEVNTSAQSMGSEPANPIGRYLLLFLALIVIGCLVFPRFLR